MRTTSFTLARDFVLSGPSIEGSTDKDLSGIGTFAYTGSPVGTEAVVVLVAN